MQKDFLDIGNPKKIIRVLGPLIADDQIQILILQHKLQSKSMLELGKNHFNFAKSLSKRNWRQKVSRYYYGAYNSSKAIRYFIDGYHSTDSSDHKKIGNLPEDFPNKETYNTRLKELRDDRNKCDYDHSITENDLFIPYRESEELTRNFLKDSVTYLTERGLE